MNKRNRTQGFTLLELLIVIAIIAILSVILVLVLNPAETLKKSRDAQRISDLNTLKTALSLVVTASTTPFLSAGNADCLNGGSSAVIYYSNESAGAVCGTNVTEGADANGTFDGTDFCENRAAGAASSIDGSGWVPVNFAWLPGGAPISNLPLDPTNSVATLATPSSTDLVYRYACQSTGGTKPSYVFEFNAGLESVAYTSDDNKLTKDGGDNTAYYEVGTDLKLLPTGTNF